MNASEGMFDDKAYELDEMNLSIQSPSLEMLSIENVGIMFVPCDVHGKDQFGWDDFLASYECLSDIALSSPSRSLFFISRHHIVMSASPS